MSKLLKLICGFVIIALLACAKKAIPEGNIKGVAKFQLSGGSAISQPGTEEYNPYVVKMPDGFLVLVFGSDRSCGSCSGHNLFVSRSTAVYNNDAVFPAFNTPVVFTVGGTPLNISGQISFAGSASGSNLRIYLTNAGGTIQYADISPTGSYNVGALTGITNTTWQVATVVGLDAAGTTLYIKKSGALYAVDPAANTPSLTAMVTGGSASSLVNVNSAFSGRSDAFFSLTNGSVGGMSLYGSGGSLTTLNTTIAKAKVSARNLSVLQTGVRKGDLMFISAVESGSSTQDMYVVDGLNVGDMWELINPKPPGAPVSGSGGGGGGGSDGSTWTARTLPSSSYWYSVSYGNGVFVAVADGPTTASATSPDGITWTARTMPSASQWRSVTYGNGVFVAVANNTTAAATSPDGITWTARTMPSFSQWSSVTYGNGVFVAVANNSTIAATSPDGVTWTAQTLPSSVLWISVTFANGIFVAVAQGSTTSATSPDGITWTARSMPSGASWYSVTYGNGVFVAVSIFSTAATTSPDGITWTARTLPSSSQWSSVTFGNGVFVAVAAGTTTAVTSPNGITWTVRTLPSAPNWKSVTYGNGVFVTVAGSPSTTAATSP